MRDVRQHKETETSQLSDFYGQPDHLRKLNAQNNGWANLVIFLIIYILACSVSAGTITGEVIDTLSGKALAGTNVVIHGTDLGAVSDISGIFTIENVPVGEHSLRIIHIGYCLQTDVVKISRKKDIIHRSYNMKYPIIPVTESKESESYHKNLYPFRNLLSIEIDIMQKGKDDAGLHASIKNNTDVDLYIPKLLDCFRVFRTIIYDENGRSISFVDLSCDTGTGTLPREAELITLAPKERIEYPGIIPITGYGLLEAGHYSIMLDYFFQPPAVIGGAYIDCGTSAGDLREEINVLNKIVRGRFISSNMVFFNKE